MEEENSNISEKFDDVVNTLTTFKKSITLLQSQIRDLEKTVKKDMKAIKKEAGKKRKAKSPSGFAKPSNVSDDLCKFMNKECGTQIARTEVTQFIISYIKENSLQSSENKKIIVPDDRLRVLLDVDHSQELTYFNLQRYMNRHFV